MTNDFKPESSPLGRKSSYRSDYAPELLYPIPRSGKRAELGLTEDRLPFVGEDLWNAYELSWLGPRGKPEVALAQFRVPAASPQLIESKSLKLNLNSYNQTRIKDLETLRTTIARDLSQAAGAAVAVSIESLAQRPQRAAVYPQGICLDALDIEVNCYTPTPGLLRADTSHQVKNEQLYSHLLKSNCLVTGQPDWGMVVVHYSGAAIDRESLLRYVISFREHNEFHEQCVERIFTDIQRACAPQELAVWARYTRRGGLDINPFRASHAGLQPDEGFEIRQ